MTDEYKRRGLVFLLLAAITTILLASALPRLVLQPGLPLPDWDAGSHVLPQEHTPIVTISISTLAKALIGLLITATCITAAVQVLRGTAWRDILKSIFKEILPPLLLVAIPLAIGLVMLMQLLSVRVTVQPAETELPPPLPKVSGPPIGSPPASLFWIVWIGLAIILGLLAIVIIRWRTAQIHRSDPFMLEAERAVEALRAGLDLRSVILRCYQQMSAELKKEQGIELEEAMTAREFERLAEARGIPDAPVHELTLLFEVARYADHPLAPGDESRALNCLTAIVRYDDEKKREHIDGKS